MDKEGIIRRLDDCGRIVIPKELRRLCNWEEGDTIQIMSHGNDAILLKKYREMETLAPLVARYSSVFYSVYQVPIAICNETVYLTSRGFRIPNLQRISNSVKSMMDDCQEHIQPEPIMMVPNQDIRGGILVPVISREHSIGAVILGEVPRRDIAKLADVARLMAQMISNQIQF